MVCIPFLMKACLIERFNIKQEIWFGIDDIYIKLDHPI